MNELRELGTEPGHRCLHLDDERLRPRRGQRGGRGLASPQGAQLGVVAGPRPLGLQRFREGATRAISVKRENDMNGLGGLRHPRRARAASAASRAWRSAGDSSGGQAYGSRASGSQARIASAPLPSAATSS